MLPQIDKYFRQHPRYNSIVHLLAGMGFGVLITYPLVQSHPLRWSFAFVMLALLGHLIPLSKK